MPKFHNVEPDVENAINDIIENLAIPESVKFKITGVEKQKTLFKIVKVPDLYAYAMNVDFILLVNQDLFDQLTGDAENAIEILADEELAKAVFDLDKGKTKLVKPDSIAFKANLKKYGFDKVERAKELEKSAIQQKEDQTEDSEKPVVLMGGNKNNPFFQE